MCKMLPIGSVVGRRIDGLPWSRKETNMQRFDGTRVVVTGGANGLGLGIAQRFVTEGAIVWIADLDTETEAIAERSGAAGVLCDVSDSSQVDALLATMTARLGGVDVVVANAGIGGSSPIVDLSDQLYRRIMGVNLDGVFFTCRAAARVMILAGAGVIVTVGSVFGRDTPANSSAYGASKAGVMAITHALARELAPVGIRVNCISPGHMDTELYRVALERRAGRRGISVEEIAAEERSAVPVGRFGTGEDVAGLVAFLASEDASYLTGQTINIDGGLQPR
jgi:meso-butanediol dehydrogenase/(S,S)-butanediol dehydrogenase/diacetyl reductase